MRRRRPIGHKPHIQIDPIVGSWECFIAGSSRSGSSPKEAFDSLVSWRRRYNRPIYIPGGKPPEFVRTWEFVEAVLLSNPFFSKERAERLGR